MRRVATLIVLAALFSLAMAQPVTIRWFVGLGTGGQPDQIDVQNAVVAAFNASQDRIRLEIEIVDNTVAVATLATLIATGSAPDIVGPVGLTGTNAFAGNFYDLEVLANQAGYDLGQFPQAAVDNQRTAEGLIGIPLANFPSFIYYRPELFDEAGLEYPPTHVGDPYVLDGQEVEWNMDTLLEVAKILTVDGSGNDATMASFNPDDIVQFGFNYQWAGGRDARQIVTLFGPGELVDANGNASMPDHWREGYQWFYDAVWTHHVHPNNAQDGSDLLSQGNPFNSGRVAMAYSHLWYTCCMDQNPNTWDAAVPPSHDGVTTARLHADTFRVLRSTAHPAEAFEVLAYLVGPASLDLLGVYGGMPAREADQDAYFAALDERFPQGVNWDVPRETFNYADAPSHEALVPNYNRALDRLATFHSLLFSQPDLNVEFEIERFLADLQVIYDEAP